MKTYRTIFLLTIWAGLMLLACTKQEEVYSDTDKVCLSASIGSMTTRVDDGEVKSGTYYLTYNSSEAKVCMVTFAESKGYPLVSDNGIYQFLKWNDVTPVDGKYQFTLDNLSNKDNPETVTLGEAYKAAPLDGNSQLDIVWGKQTVEKGKESDGVNFALSHRMSKISLEISVGTSDINLDNGIHATITLMNVISEPATFNRTSGAVSVAGKKGSDIVLYEGELIQAASKYTIPSWIVPPQTFSNNWPKLRIEFDGQTYEGTLNHYMVQEGSLDTPVEMTGFKSGQHLTLRAKLSKTTEEVELIFMPVWVRKWEEIDNIGIGAKQRGVYTEKDYKQLVTAYNKEPKKDENVLDEYGTKDDSGKWTFVLFRNIGTAEDVNNMPKFEDDGNGFEIEFNSYTVYGYDNKSHLIDNSETSGGSSGD